MILLDTNVLTRITRASDPQAGVARSAVHALWGRGERLIIVPQKDFRPRNNAIGVSFGPASVTSPHRRQ